MKLRVRFALAALATVVPIVVAFGLLVVSVRTQMIEDGLAQYARGIASS